ncbi:hypothetical protein KFK09_018852 [Dendrobium nobile]|uniref:Reverse transcriptase domain-containing protein n=1 Tax=Dendrobium nobile TaxID=94219 RepID=A0A8T3AVJ1_DENNO|nr:hypothetical protein KFK09_018852 [Dendrobium nobile]
MSLPTIASWNVRGFNNPDKVSFCKSLINSHDLKLLCILEAKISASSLEDPWFLRSHTLFENEDSCNNFGDSPLGRIWIKWDSSVLSFNLISTSPQFIHGTLSVGSFPPIFLTAIYASNSVEDRKHLWDQVLIFTPSDHPWIILGDFNCCRFQSEKAGGSTISGSRLGELNSMMFNCGVQDLSSTGLFYTWFNQQVDNPIHIKLDRVLVNNALLDFLPNAYYLVEQPLGSDHSPLIFKSSVQKPRSSRFMFKNYWINMEGYWDDVYTAFSSRSARSQMASDGLFLPQFAKTQKAIVKHFEILFNKSHPNLILPLNIPTGNLVPAHYHNMLVGSLTFEEVKAAVFEGNEKSAPGPDGFTYAFYRKSWHLIGLQVFNAVSNFFSTGSLPRGVKATAIALIPKSSHASSINDYRPISLCNVLYKIVAKIIANRLKIVLPHIIHESQSGFISNRCSTDHIILAYEILREFKGNNDKFCAKLDIQKAFDYVSRDFLIARLLQKGFPQTFVNWIRGMKCKNTYINHLMYADDLLVVGDSTRENAANLQRCLLHFNSLTGLQINASKSAIIFSNNKPENQIICDEIGIHNINTYLTYSGRVQFLKFTIINTLAYWIRGSILLKGCCATINKLCSRFLFHNSIEARKLHLISWSTVTLPKAAGGLGIPSLQALQFGVSCSIIGRFYNNPNLLSHWYKAKYTSPWKPTPINASKFWHRIAETAHRINGEITFSVANHCDYSFLWDPWLNKQPIGETLSMSFLGDKLVKDFLGNGCWRLPTFLHASTTHTIMAVELKEKNDVLWKGNSNWLFKNFTEFFYSTVPKVDWHNSIWHCNHAIKFACFTWMAMLGKLKTADNLNFRGLQTWEEVFWEFGNFSFWPYSNWLLDFQAIISRVYYNDYWRHWWRMLNNMTMMSRACLNEPWRAIAATWLVSSLLQFEGWRCCDGLFCWKLHATASYGFGFWQPVPSPDNFIIHLINLRTTTVPKF